MISFMTGNLGAAITPATGAIETDEVAGVLLVAAPK